MTVQKENMPIEEILKHLPHRFPFLFIDRVIRLEVVERLPAQGEITAQKAISYADPLLQGHFPNMPLMPGVLHMEAMMQAGCIMLSFIVPARHKANGTMENFPIFATSLDKVRFRKLTVPGDIVHYHVKTLSSRRGFFKCAGKALVDGKTACDGEFSVYCDPKYLEE